MRARDARSAATAARRAEEIALARVAARARAGARGAAAARRRRASDRRRAGYAGSWTTFERPTTSRARPVSRSGSGWSCSPSRCSRSALWLALPDSPITVALLAIALLAAVFVGVGLVLSSRQASEPPGEHPVPPPSVERS